MQGWRIYPKFLVCDLSLMRVGSDISFAFGKSYAFIIPYCIIRMFKAAQCAT